jgi:hypothetical protein
MTDFEERLTDALTHAAGDAPEAGGLVEGARTRSRARRRRTTLAVAAASVAVLGVVAGTAMLGNGGGSPPAADDPTPSVVVDPQPPQRVESWRDLQVTVPDDWGYGPLSTWCTNGATSPGTPVVERPEGMRDMILCTEPANGYGVMFFDGSLADLVYKAGHIWQYEKGDAGAAYPEGAWLGYQRGANRDNVVWVVGPDRATTEQILGSVQRITDVDVNGCSPEPTNERFGAAEGTVRLCRYAGDGWLEQGETLTGDDARQAVDALDAAPDRPAMMCPNLADQGYVVVQSADKSAEVRWEGCAGVFGWRGVQHDLTSDVLYWVLSPGWSGAVDGDVPLPDPLRRLPY